jgi:hypothetical protein
MGPINVYESHSNQYVQAFELYLRHSSEQQKTIQWLKQLVERLPSKRLFVDAGAGQGLKTEPLANMFEQTIAIEPNQLLRQQLQQRCPQIEIDPNSIMQAQILPGSADLVLCAHVFYFIAQEKWLEHLDRLASWLAPDGVIVVILAHPCADCMQIYEDFYTQNFDLAALGNLFQSERSDAYQVEIERLPVDITTDEMDSAYTIAEFLLNPPPHPHAPPMRSTVEAYVRDHYSQPTGYYMSCDQTCISIRRR